MSVYNRKSFYSVTGHQFWMQFLTILITVLPLFIYLQFTYKSCQMNFKVYRYFLS